MRNARCVGSVVGLVFKLGALAIGLSWLAALHPGDGDRRGGGLRKGAASAFSAGPAAEVNAVRMKLAEGRSFAFYSLRDEEGNELARVTYAAGGLVVNVGEALPSRPGFSVWDDGSCEFVVAHDGVHYQFKLRPGRTTGLLVLDDRRGVAEGLGVTRDGRIVRGPKELD